MRLVGLTRVPCAGYGKALEESMALCLSGCPHDRRFTCLKPAGHFGDHEGTIKTPRTDGFRQTWRGRRQGTSYPPDDGARRDHWRTNYGCIPCREVRRHYWGRRPIIPRCPQCQQPMAEFPRTMPCPSKDDPDWANARLYPGILTAGIRWIDWPRRD